MNRAFAAVLVLCLNPVQSRSQAGLLDPQFDTQGGANGPVFCAALQPNGRILIGGAFTQVGGAPAPRLARLMPDGSPDAAFNSMVDLTGLEVNCMALQPDGRILIGGNFTNIGAVPQAFIARLEADGSLDAGFAPITTGPVRSLTLLADGSMFIGGGFNSVDGISRNRMAKLTSSGALDPTFAPGTGFNGQVNFMHVLTDGRIAVCGQFTTYAGATANRIIVLEADGSRHTAFAPSSGADATTWCAMTNSAGQLLVAGEFTSFNGESKNALVALEPDGSVSTAFMPGSTGFPPGSLVSHILGSPDGTLLCAGNFTSYDGQTRQDLVRISADGAVDMSFAPSGSGGLTVRASIPQPDGKVIVFGTFTSFNGVSMNRVARIFLCAPASMYVDADADGSGDPGLPRLSCPSVPGFAANDDDCDDQDPMVTSAPTWYQDADGDGLGDPAVFMVSCTQPPGHVADFSDCDDADIAINGPQFWYRDQDGDGSGDPDSAVMSCAEPVGYVLDNTDCDDTDVDRYEGAPCNDNDPTTVYDALNESCTCIGSAVDVAARVFLDGPLSGSLMNDGLRSSGLIPLTEPYTLLGFHPGEPGGGEQVAPGVLATTGSNAIVDWVMLCLRDANPPYLRKNIRMALLQRDGDVVDVDGTSPVRFSQVIGPYMLEVRHRNHLGIMSAEPLPAVPTGTVLNIDLSAPGTACYGTNARKSVGALRALWSGNCLTNEFLSYTGSSNDRDPILVKVGSLTPNTVIAGYFAEDVTMDGLVKYTGSGNDRDRILSNVGSTSPNNLIFEQLP